jgi:hypothetical protein
MTRRQIIWGAAPLMFGLPITLSGLADYWRDHYGPAWVDQILTFRFALGLGASLVLGYAGGALFGWLWTLGMAGFGWRPDE